MLRVPHRAAARFAVGMALANLLVASTSRADDEAEPIRLEFRTPPSCSPTTVDFFARISRRTARARLATEGEAARLVRVVIAPGKDASVVSGNVAVTERDGTESHRDVGRGQCTEVTEALALVVALALDPLAQLTPAPTEPEPLLPKPPDVRPVEPDEEPRPAAPALPPHGWALSFGGDMVLVTGATPNALLGGALFVEARARSTLAGLRLAIEVGTSDASAGAAEARFTRIVGRADGCPVHLGGAALGVEPCLTVEAGAMEAAGSGVQNGRTVTRPWLAGGALLRTRWLFARPLYLEAELGLLFAAERDQFYFEPQTSVYDVPAIGMRGGLGLGALFGERVLFVIDRPNRGH